MVDASAIAGAAWRMPGEQRGAERPELGELNQANGRGSLRRRHGLALEDRRGAATPIWCWCTPPKTSSRH